MPKPEGRPRSRKVKLKGGKFRSKNTYTITRKEKIGEGVYGTAYNVQVTITTPKGTKRTLDMVEKVYDKKFYFRPKTEAVNKHIADKFKIMKEIIELNRKENLGLRIIPTIRLNKDKKESTYISTKLKVSQKTLPLKKHTEFMKDIQRQRRILEKAGFDSGRDAFFPLVDPETKKTIAILADFDNVGKREWLNQSSYLETFFQEKENLKIWKLAEKETLELTAEFHSLQ